MKLACYFRNSQYFVQSFYVPSTTDRSKLLVKSVCETAVKSLYLFLYMGLSMLYNERSKQFMHDM